MIKKAINDPEAIVDELLEGIVLASHGRVRCEPGSRAIIRSHLEADRTALLIGGGSGHEPMYAQFVGPGYADAAAAGNVFAAPPPNIILGAAQAIHRGKGVLFVYANFAGDNMNFDVAAELAADVGIETMTVRAMDDISMPVSLGRRGTAGVFFLVKVAGAACASGLDLASAHTVATRARDEIRSLSVAFRPGSLPETGEPTFAIADDEIEIGAGGHGEKGAGTMKVMPADELADLMVGRLAEDLGLRRGQRVALLVNDLGATTMMELLIVNRRVRARLDELGVTVVDTWLGPYVTAQEMAGFVVSMMRLDPELEDLLSTPSANETFLRP